MTTDLSVRTCVDTCHLVVQGGVRGGVGMGRGGRGRVGAGAGAGVKEHMLADGGLLQLFMVTDMY